MRPHRLLLAIGWAFVVAGLGWAEEWFRTPGGLKALESPCPVRADARREWTVLCYMDADNNLDGDICTSFLWLERYLYTHPEMQGRAEFIVLLDRAADPRHRTPIDGGWTTARLYRARPSEHPVLEAELGLGALPRDRFGSELLADCGELNMGDPRTLRAFLVGGARAFPAKRYAVILGDHGGGWFECANDDDAPGSGIRKDALTLPGLQSALRGAVQAIGRPRFDLVMFEMCLMGQLEVAAACKDLAETLVFSEAILPVNLLHSTYAANALLTALAEDRTPDVRLLAKRTVARWVATYGHLNELWKTTTISAVDCRKVDDLLTGFNALVGKLIPAAPQHWATFSRALYHADSYGQEGDLEKGEKAHASVDLLNAVQRMRANLKDFPAEAEYQQFLGAFKQCVLASSAGLFYRRSNGLAIYAPLRRGNYKLGAYADEALARTTPWPFFLDALHALQAQHRDKPRFHGFRVQDAQGQLTNVITPLSGAWCYYVLEGTNILRLSLSTATESPGIGDVIWHRTPQRALRTMEEWKDLVPEELDLRMPAYRDGKSVLGQDFPGVIYALASGDQIILATVEERENGETAVVRGLLTDPRKRTKDEAQIVFDMNRWTASQLQVLAPVGGGIVLGSITPEPDFLFQPWMEVLDESERPVRLPGNRFAWKDGPRLVMTLLPPGEQALYLEAETVAGVRTRAGLAFKCRRNPFIEDHLKKGPKLAPHMLVGTWKWQTPHLNPQTGQKEFQDWGVQVALGPYNPKDPPTMSYSFRSAKKETQGIIRLETQGLPILSFLTRDALGALKRDLALVPFYQPVGQTPAFLLVDLRSGDQCRFLQVSPTPLQPGPPSGDPWRGPRDIRNY